MFVIFGKTSIYFMGWRYYSFALSMVCTVFGLLAMIQIGRGAATLGIDFARGTAVQLKFEQPLPIETARAALQNQGVFHPELQEFGDSQTILIRVKADTGIEEKLADRIVAIFTQHVADNRFTVESTTEVGPTIGRKLQQDALLALLISFAGIVGYIAARFELRFGIAAAPATFHDVLAVLGIFYLLGKEITLLVVTALLTLAGYSSTDTVVVFDRIRETMRQRRRESAESLINTAINQVSSRTMVTSLTVVLVLIPLTVAGGEVLHDFSLALLAGVLIGTYSSIFVASPLLTLWTSPGQPVSRG
jgi:preprotein translocase subunit SecF